MISDLLITLLLTTGTIPVSSATPPTEPKAIIASYEAATSVQSQRLSGTALDVEIEASVPKLKKQGRMFGLRKITEIGKVTYDKIRFEGDSTVKTQVIARYLSAETNPPVHGEDVLISERNYKFKFKGIREFNGRKAHVFELSPRKKRVGLFKGEIWIDTETSLPLMETGKFVKNPSVFLKGIEFSRTYSIIDGVAVPQSLSSIAKTRIAGDTRLSITYRKSMEQLPAQAQATPDTGQDLSTHP